MSGKSPHHIDDSILGQILNSVDAYIYTKDIAGKYTYANQAVLELFDKSLAEIIGCDDSHFFDLALSAELTENDQQVIKKAIRVEGEEYNFIKNIQAVRIFKTVKKPLFDAQGNVSGMCGVSTDITSEKKLQEQVNEQAYLLDTILNNIDAHIYMKNNERTFMYVNSKVAELFGESAKNIIGKKDYDVLPQAIADHFYQSDKEVFASNQKQVIDETVIDENNIAHHYISTKIPFSQPGKPPALIGFSSDVTELYNLKEQFKKLANTDSLTNLYNRRFFTKQAHKEFQRAKRYSQVMTLISIDIDHFKVINDKYGHPAGDKVLIDVSACLSQNLRESDVLARIGGEEFSILLPETSLEDAKILAERIRVEQSELVISGKWQGDIKLTVSIGMSSLTENDVTFDALFSRTDKALYLAKTSGRNQVYTL
ncbi:sensor domain-containing diguanylate cyclase [Colwellia sp. D2M02]|uniref:sensor domain-containing diguanylate cyclase n=1 Tax=Colwellia sp. D2M02 TaxID=2841562 RepID=UPI001C08E74D|nr:sensor domain-containing diguanylate cyclase [Colwellia sp. D2M02]MBU2892789.1 sensor domain-containing diguanylate cyclase [Colwellia sp. D2M02]